MTKEDLRMPLGYAYRTKHIVNVCNELIEMVEELRETTRNKSHWQLHSSSDRVKQAKAISELAKALYEIVRARERK